LLSHIVEADSVLFFKVPPAPSEAVKLLSPSASSIKVGSEMYW